MNPLKWFKSWLISYVATPEKMEQLIGDLFAMLRNGVAMTPNPVDDIALATLEAKIDKAALAAALAARLKDLLD